MKIDEGASVLDMVILYPGTHVKEFSLLGSSSVLADGSELAEGAIATGCDYGTAVILKTRTAEQRMPVST